MNTEEKEPILERLKALGWEILAVLAAILLFAGAMIPILLFFPMSVTVDVGGELHMMTKGIAVGFVSLLCNVVMFWVGRKTYWKYAIKPSLKNIIPKEGSDEVDVEDISFRKDFIESDTTAKRYRTLLFSASFTISWIIWIYCLTPDAVIAR